jgi:isoleucyl-tRNA synthetase
VPGVGVVPARAEGSKCARCWQIHPVVDPDGLCVRCADAVAALAAP